jgi:hypothetical protein
MADLAPIKERLAKCIRLFGSTERANARTMTERALASIGASWTDLGDWIEKSYTEDEMLEMVAAVRQESVEAGIKIGEARGTQSNGHITLPESSEMAEYCHGRLQRLKNDWQRDFITDIYNLTRRGRSLSLPRLANLAKIYIELGGKT